MAWFALEEHFGRESMEHKRLVIIVNGTFICPTRKGFCATVYYTEEDYFPDDDKLAYVPIHCTHTNTLTHSVILILEEGDGFLDNYFELAIRAHHDCPGVGQHKEIYRSWDTIPVNKNGMLIRKSYITELRYDEWTPIKEEHSLLWASEGWRVKPDPITEDWAAGKDVTSHKVLFEIPRLHWVGVDFEEGDWTKKMCLVTRHMEILNCYFSLLPLTIKIFNHPRYDCQICKYNDWLNKQNIQDDD